MRAYLLFFLIIISGAVVAQKTCYQHSRLYLFNKSDEPRLFTDPLGRHPQFPFLQRVNGITTSELFIKSIRDSAQRKKYSRTFKAFDLLLRNSGFWHGYKDLNSKNVRKVYITPGTIGNLGFFNPQTNVMNYLYVKLNPAGESADGVEAWKLINNDGCFLYILFTCGNAFYPNGDAVVVTGGGTVIGTGTGPDANDKNGACCRTVTMKSEVTAVPQQTDSVRRTAELRMNHYRAYLTLSRKKGRTYDTAVTLIRSKDTLLRFKDRLVIPAKMDSASRYKVYSVCRDSVVNMRFPLVGDLAQQTDTLHPVKYVMSDTVYEKETVKEEEDDCENKWEVSIEAGKSWNSIPRLDDPVQHTQTNGSQTTATLEISRILARWFQLGVSASYVILSYQDDINYPGYTGGYNTIYLGKPIIPIQLFGKFNFGKPVGFQTSLQLSFGYSVPTNQKIENNGITLTTDPNLKGDFTAGLKFGIAYYFTCHIGVSASFTGQYFNNKSDLIAYSLYALPVQGGLHFRF